MNTSNLKTFFWDELMEKLTTKSIFDGIELLWINIKQRFISLYDFTKVATKYYPNLPFMKADFSLLLMYLVDSPYIISRRFLQEKGENNIHAYGETPLSSMHQIADICNITKNDHIYELGCGRGRTCFWLKYFIGCRVTGIDFVDKFIERANRIKNKSQIDGLSFLKEDFMNINLSDATVIYLYGTSLEDDSIKQLISKFEALSSGTKIITVSYPLKDYTLDDSFELMQRFNITFPWGDTDVYLQTKK